MTTETRQRAARALAGVAALAETATGLGLLAAPTLALRLMGAGQPEDVGLLGLRWVGIWVLAVGLGYAWGLRRGGAVFWAMLELTVILRVAAGGFVAGAMLLGALDAGWWSVPVWDWAVAAAQVWLVRQEVRRG